MITFGKGAATSFSQKQKINTINSTDAELVGVDDASTLLYRCAKIHGQEK